MAITSRDTLIAAMAGGTSVLMRSNFGAAASFSGTSGSTFNDGFAYWTQQTRAGTYPTAALAPTLCTGSTPGAVPLPALTSGNTFYLGAVAMTSSVPGPLFLLDRLAHVRLNGNTTSVQTVNLTRPARSISASGVVCLYENPGNSTTGGSVTLSYTAVDGTSGRTATISASGFGLGYTAMAPLVTVADKGISSVQTAKPDTTTSFNTATPLLVLARIVAVLNIPVAYGSAQLNFMDIAAPALGADPCLYLATWGNGQQPATVHGTVRIIQG